MAERTVVAKRVEEYRQGDCDSVSLLSSVILATFVGLQSSKMNGIVQERAETGGNNESSFSNSSPLSSGEI